MVDWEKKIDWVFCKMLRSFWVVLKESAMECEWIFSIWKCIRANENLYYIYTIKLDKNMKEIYIQMDPIYRIITKQEKIADSY